MHKDRTVRPDVTARADDLLLRAAYWTGWQLARDGKGGSRATRTELARDLMERACARAKAREAV